MESTKEMLLPRPAMDGMPQSLDSVVVDSSDSAGPKLYIDVAQVEHTETHISNGVVPSNLYASDPNLTMLPDNSIRARLRRILSTHRFQVQLKQYKSLWELRPLKPTQILFRCLLFHLL